MDALSSSVPTLKVPSLNSTPREFIRHFKTPTGHSRFLPHQPTKTASLSQNPTFFFHPKKPSALFSSSHSSPVSPSTRVHRKPAMGYAAALLETSQYNNSLLTMRKDVQKLWNLLRRPRVQALLNDPLLGRKEKGLAVGALAGSGGLNRHLVGLSKMLIGRNKLEMVSETLEEFQRIFDELIGTTPELTT